MRAPRRTLLTVLGIGAVLSVLVAFLGLIDSFDATVNRSEAEIAKGNPGRISVSLDGFRRDRPALRAIRAAPGVAEAEPRLVLPITLSSGENAGFDASLTLLDFSSSVWAPTIQSGSAPRPGEPGIAIAEKAAEDLGIRVGDDVTLKYPRRQAGGFVQVKTNVRVTALHPDPFRIFAYMDRTAGVASGFQGLANQVAVTPKPGTSENQVARALFRVRAVASVERATATTKFVRERLDDFIGVLRLIEGFALALALLIAFNSSSISIDERRRENATMLAFGIPSVRALRLSVGESVITGVLGTIVGIGGGFLVVSWVVDQTLPETLPDVGLVTHIAPSSLLVAAVVGTVAVALAPLLSSRRIRRMDIPSTLRVME